ncbi:hypothetical protein C8R45DRAFT_944950 [Mycena sanguinolenta]|nr:hypothetical protein C8R45DRAFT_944950 [Mycena sanguinolenta]
MQLKVLVAFALALATHAGAAILERQAQEFCIPETFCCSPGRVYPPPFPPQGCCPGFVCISNSVDPLGCGDPLFPLKRLMEDVNIRNASPSCGVEHSTKHPHWCMERLLADCLKRGMQWFTWK